MKTNYVSGDATNGARLTFASVGNTGGSVLVTTNDISVKTTTDWTQYSGTFTTDANSYYIRVSPRIYGHQGTATLIMDAWFDDVELFEAGTVSRTRLFDPGTQYSSEAVRRQSVRGVQLPNASFSAIPVGTDWTTTNARWLDGTAGGSLTNSNTRCSCQSVIAGGRARIDPTQGYLGLGSVHLSASTAGSNVNVFYPELTAPSTPAGFYPYAIRLKPSTTYEISVRMKTEYFSGSGTIGANAQFYAYNSAGTLQTNAAIMTAIRTTTDWTEYKAFFTTNSSSVYGLVQFALDGRGGSATLIMDAWFDDLRIEEMPSMWNRRRPISGNLLYNPDFEVVPAGGTTATNVSTRWLDGTAGGSTVDSRTGWALLYKNQTAEAKIDDTVFHSGTRSLKLSTIAGTSAVAEVDSTLQTAVGAAGYYPFALELKPSTNYRLSGWMKTELISGSSANGASFGLLGYPLTGTTTTINARTSNILTTTDWTYYEVDFTTTNTTKWGIFDCIINGTGAPATLLMDAWFDDLSLVELSPTTRTRVT
jgi:hypothetical protein